MASENSTFSLRLPPKDYKLLESYAHLCQTSIAAKAREFILAGLLDALSDTAEIERQMDARKARLLLAAAEMRRATGD